MPFLAILCSMIFLLGVGTCQTTPSGTGLICVDATELLASASYRTTECKPNQRCYRIDVQLNYTEFSGTPLAQRASREVYFTHCANQTACDVPCMDAYNKLATQFGLTSASPFASQINATGCKSTCCDWNECGKDRVDIINANKATRNLTTSSSMAHTTSTSPTLTTPNSAGAVTLTTPMSPTTPPPTATQAITASASVATTTDVSRGTAASLSRSTANATAGGMSTTSGAQKSLPHVNMLLFVIVVLAFLACLRI